MPKEQIGILSMGYLVWLEIEPIQNPLVSGSIALIGHSCCSLSAGLLLWSTLWWKCFSHPLRWWVAVGLRRYVGVAGQTGRFIVYSQTLSLLWGC
jgi:hypothetical protein